MSEFLLVAAMPDEAAAIHERSASVGAPVAGPTARSSVTPITLAGRDGTLLTTGIGPVNAAAALTGWLAAVGSRSDGAPRPRVISVGSAGGLAERVRVGDVVLGRTYRYADVDAREFGYEFGQVPGMPAEYAGTPEESGAPGGDRSLGPHVHEGLLVTSSSFVGAQLAEGIRSQLPAALAVDMESAALAQTCLLLGLDRFVSVRGISDLCTPQAGQDFHSGLASAAARSADAVLALLTE